MKESLVLPAATLSRREKTLRMAQMAMLIAISSVLVFICFPLIPAAPFLKYDMADVPVLLAAFTMGTPAGLLVLAIASAIQAFLFGHDGPIGFIMHMVASGTLVLVATGMYNALHRSRRGMIAALAIGCVAWVLIMIPLNFIFTPKVMMDVPVAEAARLMSQAVLGGYDPAAFSEAAVTAFNTVKGLLLVGLIPFNLLKAVLNSVIFFLLYKTMKRLLKADQADQ